MSGKLGIVSDNPYRGLPSVDVLAAGIDSTLPRPVVVDACRLALEDARTAISAGSEVDPDESARKVVRAIERAAGVPVINATGVLLHTNLGRAPWSEEAISRATAAARGYSNLEIDIESGERSRRGDYVERLLRLLTGAEAAFVANNNASALLIALAALSKGRSVPVARGELIEIGGSYRLPEVMDASGARLVEVGTTNRTRVGDYQTALQTHSCGAVLKVHPSNYRIEGFTEEASVGDLAKLAIDHGVPLLHDVGSGLLDADVSWLPDWLRDEPGVRQSLLDGAEVVTFSGDKLLGGPQAGIMVGSARAIDQIRRNALARALRVDGITYAALAATLEAHLKGPPVTIPFWRYALLGDQELKARCVSLASRVGGGLVTGSSAVGAGSAPGTEIPTPQVRIQSAQHLYGRLLALDRPILARRDGGDLVVDLRAIEPEDDETVAASIERCL